MTARPRPLAGTRARPVLLAGLLAAATLAGCFGGTATGPVHSLVYLLPEGEALVRSELYFGRLRSTGAVVTDAEWQAFLTEHVTPRFPEGFTVLDGAGQYRDRSGTIVSEPTRILLVVHEPTTARMAAVQELRAIYRERFQQESVLLIAVPARAAF